MEYKEVINIEIWELHNGCVELRTKSPYSCVKELLKDVDTMIPRMGVLLQEMKRLTNEIKKLGYGTNFIYKGDTPW